MQALTQKQTPCHPSSLPSSLGTPLTSPSKSSSLSLALNYPPLPPLPLPQVLPPWGQLHQRAADHGLLDHDQVLGEGTDSVESADDAEVDIAFSVHLRGGGGGGGGRGGGGGGGGGGEGGEKEEEEGGNRE